MKIELKNFIVNVEIQTKKVVNKWNAERYCYKVRMTTDNGSVYMVFYDSVYKYENDIILNDDNYIDCFYMLHTLVNEALYFIDETDETIDHKIYEALKEQYNKALKLFNNENTLYNVFDELQKMEENI